MIALYNIFDIDTIPITNKEEWKFKGYFYRNKYIIRNKEILEEIDSTDHILWFGDNINNMYREEGIVIHYGN